MAIVCFDMREKIWLSMFSGYSTYILYKNKADPFVEKIIYPGQERHNNY